MSTVPAVVPAMVPAMVMAVTAATFEDAAPKAHQEGQAQDGSRGERKGPN